MASYAEEFRGILCDLSQLEKIAEESSSAKARLVPTTLAAGCSSTYNNFCKHAGAVVDRELPYAKVAHLTNYAMKLATDLGIQNDLDTAIKLGSAILVDQTLAEQLPRAVTRAQQEKLAELQVFGREYIINLLQGVFRV